MGRTGEGWGTATSRPIESGTQRTPPRRNAREFGVLAKERPLVHPPMQLQPATKEGAVVHRGRRGGVEDQHLPVRVSLQERVQQ